MNCNISYLASDVSDVCLLALLARSRPHLTKVLDHRCRKALEDMDGLEYMWVAWDRIRKISTAYELSRGAWMCWDEKEDGLSNRICR